MVLSLLSQSDNRLSAIYLYFLLGFIRYQNDAATLTVAVKFKQYACISFYMKLIKSTETLEIFFKALGKYSFSQTQVFDWHTWAMIACIGLI